MFYVQSVYVLVTVTGPTVELFLISRSSSVSLHPKVDTSAVNTYVSGQWPT